MVEAIYSLVHTSRLAGGVEKRGKSMRIIILLVGLIIALGWIGVEVRKKHRPASNVMFAFALLFMVLLAGAVYDFL